jgi:hypothetical protein
MVALPVTVHNAWRYRERSVQLLRTGAHTEGYPGTGMTLRPAFYGARPGFRKLAMTRGRYGHRTSSGGSAPERDVGLLGDPGA